MGLNRSFSTKAGFYMVVVLIPKKLRVKLNKRASAGMLTQKILSSDCREAPLNPMSIDTMLNVKEARGSPKLAKEVTNVVNFRSSIFCIICFIL